MEVLTYRGKKYSLGPLRTAGAGGIYNLTVIREIRFPTDLLIIHKTKNKIKINAVERNGFFLFPCYLFNI